MILKNSNPKFFNIYFLKKAEFVLIPIYIFFLTVLISRSIERLPDFDPTVPMHQTSALAFGQLIFWISVILIWFLAVIFFYKSTLTKTSIFKFFMVTVIGVLSGVMTGTALLALDGTPFYFGLFEGDLGVHMRNVDNAMKYGWDQSGYPPLWSFIVATINEVFGLDPFTSYKFISIYFIGIWTTLNLFIFRAAFPPILAELLALYFTFSFGIDGWKGAAEIWTQIVLLILIKKIYSSTSTSFKKEKGFRVKTIGLGLIFGLCVTLYYGRLWWIAISVAIAILFTFLLRENRIDTQLLLIDFSLGAAVALMPVMLLSSTGSLLTRTPADDVDAVKYLDISWLILGLVILIWLFTKVPKKLENIFATVFSILSPIVILFAVSKFTIKDTYTNGGYIFGNMVPDFGYDSLVGTFLLLFLISIATFFAIREKNELIVQILFLGANLISALLMMFFFAYQMYRSGNVELYPRAGSTISASWILILASFAFLLLQRLEVKISQSVSAKLHSGVKWVAIVGFTSATFFVGLYASQKLADLQWNMFPREGNHAWYAWTSRLTYVK